MGRTVDEVLATLPKTRRERVERRYRELKDEVESLQQLRRAAGKAQVDVAAALKIKQPSVSKIEKQTDLYLSTLRTYVEALGGELDLVVRLPSRRALRIRQLGQLAAEPAVSPRSTGTKRPSSGRRPSPRSKRRAG